MYSDIKSVVLHRKGQQHTSLTISMLNPFLQVIQALPLANLLSDKAMMLRDVSATLTCCMLDLHGLAQWVLGSLVALNIETPTLEGNTTSQLSMSNTST